MSAVAPLIRRANQASPTSYLYAFTLPLLSMFLAVVLGSIPWGVNQNSLFVPDLLAPTLFFWGVHQPRNVSILIAFAFGLITDIIDNTPLGSQALAYMIMLLIAKSQASTLVHLGLFFKWGLFVLSIILFVALKLLVSLGFYGHLATVATWPAALFSLQLVLVTSVAYVGIHLLLAAVNSALPAPYFSR
ncbi:MAG: rod shape-determining protein MreD [Alphaproteobacteria bacterium]